MAIFKTEITSDKIASDNPLHQRLLKPYVIVSDMVGGRVLEPGCGEGRGVPFLLPVTDYYLGIDKIEEVIHKLSAKHPEAEFRQTFFPPFNKIDDNSFDFVLSFQVIEHIKNDRLFLEEIYRVLQPGGKAFITTPNIKRSLSRNPWHIREYTADGLNKLAESIFDSIEMKGITGNEKVQLYHENNRRSVEKIMKYDFLNLQYRLPAFILKIPYEILNRINRNTLKTGDNELVSSIRHEDYILSSDPDSSLDLFGIFSKK